MFDQNLLKDHFLEKIWIDTWDFTDPKLIHELRPNQIQLFLGSETYFCMLNVVSRRSREFNYHMYRQWTMLAAAKQAR